MKILLIIPAYNEEASIKRVYDTINKYNKTAKQKYDVLVMMAATTGLKKY